jgi:pimeloyl-ACP methyl ester carboxylesterase
VSAFGLSQENRWKIVLLEKCANLANSLRYSFLTLALTACATTGQQEFDPVSTDITNVDSEFPPVFHELFIPSYGVSLTGFMLGANGRGPHPTIVLLHGYPGNEKNLDVAQSMRRAGFNVLFFHYRGAWGSQGDYSLTHLSQDAASALSYLRREDETLRVDVNKLSIVGHSMGGFAALRSGAQDSDVVCVAGIAAANLGEYSTRAEAQSKAFQDYTDQLFMLHGFDGAQALKEIVVNADEYDVRNYGPGFRGKSVLLITGSEDTTVPPEVQNRIEGTYREEPDIYLTAKIIPGDHSFSANRIQLQREVVGWLDKNCR